MDMLLTESRIFLCRRDTESITPASPHEQKTYRQYELFCSSFARVPGLAFVATKRCLQSGKHDPSRIAVWFVAAGVLTAEMVM